MKMIEKDLDFRSRLLLQNVRAKARIPVSELYIYDESYFSRKWTSIGSVICANLSLSDPVLDLSSSFGGTKPVNWFPSKFLQKYTQNPYKYHTNELK